MLSCNITRQLLPSYADGLLDDESRREVEEHLAACEACAAALRQMQAGPAPAAGAQAGEVDYLARLRRKNRRRVALAVVAVFVFFAVVLGTLARFFYFGAPVASRELAIEQFIAVSEEGDQVYTLDFELESAGRSLRMKPTYREDGTGIVLTPMALLNNPWNDMGNRFSYGIHLPWEQGYTITVRCSDRDIVYEVSG